VRIIFAGTPDVGIPVADSISSHLVGVLTRPDAEVGRGRDLRPSPVAQWATERSIDIFKASKSNPELVEWLSAKQPDLGVVVAYGALLPVELLSIPVHGWLNIHFSLLPHLRGAAPVQRAILNGDDITGVSIFQLDEGMDTGPIYGTSTHEIGSKERSEELLRALTLESIPLLRKVIDGISEGTLRPVPQDEQGATYAPKIVKEEHLVRWDRPCHSIERQVRAFHPFSFTSFRGERIALLEVAESLEPVDLSVGELVVSSDKVFVGCAFGVLEISRLRPAGKKEMPAADWARGARIIEGERFE